MLLLSVVVVVVTAAAIAFIRSAIGSIGCGNVAVVIVVAICGGGHVAVVGGISGGPILL